MSVSLLMSLLSVLGYTFSNTMEESYKHYLKYANEDTSVEPKFTNEDAFWQSWSYNVMSSAKYEPLECDTGHCSLEEECESRGSVIGKKCILDGFRTGVCCVDKSCTTITKEDETVFHNPNFPKGETNATNCAMALKTSPTTCGVRIDFIEMNLTPSLDSFCFEDTITILINPHDEGNYNSVTCGKLSSYSTVLEAAPAAAVQVVVLTQSAGALWRIRVVQIPCAAVKPLTEDACGLQNSAPDTTGSNTSRPDSGPIYVKKRNSTAVRGSWQHVQERAGAGAGAGAARVFSGREAARHQFPWMAALLRDGAPHCAASLLARLWLLTAAHCVDLTMSETPPIQRLSVMLGVHRLPSSDEPHSVSAQLGAIVRHPAHVGVNYDLALLRLARPVQYGPAVRPICLPSSETLYISSTPTIAGWGVRADGMLSPVLLTTEAPFVGKASCQTSWKRKNADITDNMLCTEPRGCNGDSGGPLMLKDDDDLFRVIGVISFGAPICGDPSLPDVYVKVESFLKWILTAMVEVTS